MMIESEYSFNFIALHENKGDTIGKAQPLIWIFFEKIDRLHFLFVGWSENIEDGDASAFYRFGAISLKGNWIPFWNNGVDISI